MSTPSDDPLASFYRMLWPENGAIDPRFALFERDFGGRAIEDVLYEQASQVGIGPDSVILDVGCGKGRHAYELSRRFSCRVIAIDPLEHCLRIARQRATLEGVDQSVDFRHGDLEKLPVGDREVDLVWCLDTFNHARDIAGSFREFARVLKPQGMVFNCSALETPTLELREKDWLCRTLSLNPETFSRRTIEELLASNGLRVLSGGSTTEMGSMFFERIDDKAFLHIKRLAHMVRDEHRFVEAFGQSDFQIVKAHALWNACLLIGKITYQVWIIGAS